MKAVVDDGLRQISVQDVPDGRIERSTDVLVETTSTNVCGSDLHTYEGRTDSEPGRWFGHENVGRVVEVGTGVDEVAAGDRVVVPLDVVVQDLLARLRSAERRAAQLQDALTSNRRIGIAVGVLMCRYGLTDEQAIAFLRRVSQERNVKVRELSEEVIGPRAHVGA